MNLLRLNIKRFSITDSPILHLLSVVKLFNNDGKVHILINFCELRCMKLVTRDFSNNTNNNHHRFIFNESQNSYLNSYYLPFWFVAVGLWHQSWAGYFPCSNNAGLVTRCSGRTCEIYQWCIIMSLSSFFLMLTVSESSEREPLARPPGPCSGRARGLMSDAMRVRVRAEGF